MSFGGENALAWAHAIVRDWFLAKFGSPTEPQEQGWPHILARHTTLIAAPTGSGKTLAAFLACIDRLVRQALAGDLQDRTEVLYVSPLKALGNDIQKNLEVPLGEILQLAAERGLLMPEIRTAVRTGDTLMRERRAMLQRPPHILVTTPESLYILLTAEKSRRILRDVDTVIVDEIHAVAGDKRGSHLTLSLERLDALIEGSGHPAPVRIGLSATQKPIEEIAHFLTGQQPAPQDPAIVDVGHRRAMDLQIEVPGLELGPVASNEMWDEIYERIGELVRRHRSTLVFVNTRRMAERVSHHLAEKLGENAVGAHHGSLSRKLRLMAEHKLKNGELSVLVATASLQLGIDIGTVDLVIQIGSPRSIAVALQRVGRAGHWRGAIPKGRLFVTTRDELCECAALIRAIKHGELDRILIPEAPLDILAQQLVATCAAETQTPVILSEDAATSDRPALATARRVGVDGPLSVPENSGISEDGLFYLVRRAYPYRNLSREDFNAILEMLSEGISARRGRFGAFLHRDRINGRVRARRGARLAAITSGGAIPDNALFTVVASPEGTVVGTVDEDFAVESLAGDIFILGNTSWRIRRIESSSGRMLVEDARGAPPGIPFWLGEAPARTAELSEHVAKLRTALSARLPNTSPVGLTTTAPEVAAAMDWLKEECGLDSAGAEQVIRHLVAGRAVLGDVPTQRTIIAERFFDEGGGMQLVIHAPFGGRINKAWGLALRKRFCRSFNFELQAAATDDGINIALAEQHSFPLADVFHFLQPETVQGVLEQAVLTGAPVFGTRFRWDATRALALLRFRGGKKIPPQVQRILADDLLASVFPDVAACGENIEGDIRIPQHPLIKEVMKDVLHEAMDLDGLRAVLSGIQDGAIRCLAVDTPVPSQFSHEILNANPYAFLDDAPLEERRARAVQMRQMLPESVLQEVGRLDPVAIGQVQEEAWPDVRDADELHDALLTLIALPETCGTRAPAGAEQDGARSPSSAYDWAPCLDLLLAARRSVIAQVNGRSFWLAAERAPAFRSVYPDAKFDIDPPEISALGGERAPTVSQEVESEHAPAQSRDGERSAALLQMLTGWMQHIGPTTAGELSALLAIPETEINQTLLRLESTGAILRGSFRPAEAPGFSSAKPGAENSGALALAPSTIDHRPSPTEWCDRRLLARIHRLTLGALRREIEPVTEAQLMRWLLCWQHVAPNSQLSGEHGLLEVLKQLQGFEVPANAWERQVLARRLSDYDPKQLDQLCLTGAIGWGRLSPHPATLEDAHDGRRRVIPTSVAPITFFVREDADWMTPRRPESIEEESRGLSVGARDVLAFLRQRGASFFPDIVRGTAKLKSEVETALWELVAAGLVTADGFDNLRSLIDPRRRSGQGSGRTARPRHSAGRWSLLYPIEQPDRNKMIEATCSMLLARYGVVFRDLLAREAILPKWRELGQAFRCMEARGDIRGGRFVSGFLGEQYALPVAVESLRALRRMEPTGETITLSAADPLNLVGIIVPGERVPAISGKTVTYRDGVAVTTEERALAVGLSTPITAATGD
ncbi:MAG: DEAD/DEAH box helicase [Acidobacteriia bacterium]|nr:DEAD/DEAH box helicase [Terriglobia bacterium]